MANRNSTSSGMGFFGVLQIVFVVLKLCKVIAWSWVWVLSPTWINLIFWVIAFVIVFLTRK